MTITTPEPEPPTRERVSDSAPAAADVGERSAAARGELVLLGARERKDGRAVAESAAGSSPGGLAPSSGASAAARRLRLAPPVQLQLVCEREGPRAEVVWASLPEWTREAVLVLLARLIGSGAVEQEGGL